jgi:uncharacterized protein (DUF2267 family)
MSDNDHIDAIDTTVQKTYTWLRELCAELGVESRRKSYQVLRGVLHALRDRLTVDEAAHLGAQLPMLVRGIFYEAWDPSHKPDKMSADEFLARIQREALLSDPESAREAARAVMQLLYRHIAAGEMDDVVGALPKDIREMLLGVQPHAV